MTSAHKHRHSSVGPASRPSATSRLRRCVPMREEEVLVCGVSGRRTRARFRHANAHPPALQPACLRRRFLPRDGAFVCVRACPAEQLPHVLRRHSNRTHRVKKGEHTPKQNEKSGTLQSSPSLGTAARRNTRAHAHSGPSCCKHVHTRQFCLSECELPKAKHQVEQHEKHNHEEGQHPHVLEASPAYLV